MASRIPHPPARRHRSASKEEQHQLFLSGFGPRLPELAWGTARQAVTGLDERERKRVDRAVQQLDSAWLGNPTHGLVRALSTAVRGVIIVHSGARSAMPSWCVHDHCGVISENPAAIFGEREIDLSRCRLYRLEGGDPYAERPVNLATLTFDPDRLMPLFEVLSFAGLHHQLRIVAYDDDARLMGYFGSYLPKEEVPYSLSEHAALHALVPALRRWLATARSLGVAPFQETGLTLALEQASEPAYLKREDGQIVFANAAARRFATRGRRELLSHHVGQRSLPLRAGYQILELVTFPDDAGSPSIEQLPSSLKRVALGLRAGLADKEIAEQLALPLLTVRTYTARIFTKLGISSRRQLMK